MRSDADERLRKLVSRTPPYEPNPRVAATAWLGDCIVTSGQIAATTDGLLATGRVGEIVSAELAYRCARQCTINLLARVEEALTTLTVIRSIVRMTVYVASTDAFRDHHLVAHGASDLLIEVLGPRAIHTRAAIGVSSLPLGSPVEVDAIIDVGRGARELRGS